jgi:hypothetical protein
MAKISETELQKRLRKLEASIADPSDTVVLTDDQYTLTENVIYIAYASALSNLVNGIIPNQSDATDFQYSPYNIAGVLMAYRGYFSSTSIYASGDPTDYLWESTTGLSGFESSERYYTTSTGLLTTLGNPTEPGSGITWTVISPGAAVPGTAIWLAERYTVSGITSGWSITSVAAYIDTSLLIDDSVTTAKLVNDSVTNAKIANDAIDSAEIVDGSIDTAHIAADAITGAKIADDAVDSEHYTNASIDNAHLADDAVGIAELSATGTASSSTFLRGDNSWVTPTDTNTTYSVQDGGLSQINFTSADHTKLNAIEASADVTDATNVTAAGALMDSELAGIAAVKATTGTFLSADESKLDGIEASATADQTQSEINALGITATSVDLGDWTITETGGGVLYFATGGTNKMRLEANGNLACVGTVTGSVTL